MRYITVTELKKNLDHYLELSNQEDVYVTKHGKIISVLKCPEMVGIDDLLKLKGTLKKYDDGRNYKDIIRDSAK